MRISKLKSLCLEPHSELDKDKDQYIKARIKRAGKPPLPTSPPHPKKENRNGNDERIDDDHDKTKI
jgi:hypothetical protein